MSWLDDIKEQGAKMVANALDNNASATNSTADFADARIWLDEGEHVGTADSAERNGGPNRQHVMATVADTRNYVLGLAGSNSPGYIALAENLYRKGALYDMRYASNVNTVLEANDRAMKMYLASPYAKSMSYAQWLTGAGMDRGGDGGGGSSGGGAAAYNGPVSRVTLTNEFDARALVDNALNQYLGRDATSKERERFWKRLNKREAANPDTATPVGHDTVQTGGFNREQFAVDFAQSRDDYAETQASTTLMDWVKESLTNDTRMI